MAASLPSGCKCSSSLFVFLDLTEAVARRDKCCIDQSDIARTLRCLPVMVQSCGRLLILCGDTYCQRLWCVWELYTWFAMSGADAAKRTTIVNVKRPAREAARLEHLKQQLQASGTDGDGAAGVSDAEVLAAEAANALQQEADEETPTEEFEGSDDWDGVSALVDFDVKEAHCFSQEDEAKLRRVIESESAETFNSAIREAGEALLDAAETGTLRASRIVRPGEGAGSAGDTGGAVSVENPVVGAGAGADTAESASDKALRLEFQTLDANSDGRLCRQDLLRAFGGDGSASGKGWFSEAQVDELLKCIATAQPQILVNGSLSIGLPEYKAWVRRAR
eukprot:COSAG06_NODE_766_length_12468_cov_14.138076_5_plen_336_part_00